MFESITKAKKLMRRAVAELDPDVLEARTAAALVEDLAEIERLAAAGKALAARRMAASGTWRTDGERSPAHWVARRTGTSVGRAAAVLETAERLAELPATEQAVRAGRLSETQAQEIASAGAADPSAEQELVEVALTEGVGTLRRKCRAVRAAATDSEERYQAIHRSRYLRSWTDSRGAWRLDASLTPDAGAVVLAALEPHREAVLRSGPQAEAPGALRRLRGRRPGGDGRVIPFRWLGVTLGPKAMVHVLVDHSALVRGVVEAGETCEIPGVGPIPASTAQELATDAFITALVTDGTDILAVSHPGRTMPARLRTAVETRDRCCAVLGCDATDHLEIDHIVAVTKGGKTELINLARLCRWHHYLKTHRGYRLLGPPGKWRWVGPKEKE